MMPLGIDAVHAALVHGLVAAHKPREVLEIGYGDGTSCKAIVSAMDSAHARYHLVDDWSQWGGVRPEQALKSIWYPSPIIYTSDEGTFVDACQNSFDFIFSDGDHDHAHEWDDRVFYDLLNPGGILCYHDVCYKWPGLCSLVEKHKGRSVVFNKSTKPYEACQRGLLVIFK